MATSHGVNLLDVFHLPPSEPREFSVPLTCFDTIWMKFHPVERLFFYETPHFTANLFFHSVLPNLKTSLSITLSHFLPLAGNLLWPPHCAKPFLQFTPGDAVAVTLAEVNDVTAFDRLAGDAARPAAESRLLLPKLVLAETKASAIALQLTFFPNKGLCIGLICHHAVLDGQSSIMFMKAWAHIFRNIQEGDGFVTLTPELTPLFDRNGFKDPTGLDMVFLNFWIEEAKSVPGSNPRSLELLGDMPYSPDLYRATFRLSQNDVNNLKNKLLSLQQGLGRETQRFSTFVTTCAYVKVCKLKATKYEGANGAYFLFAADFRSRLNPPIPKNYMGNCIALGGTVAIEARDFSGEDGVANLAVKISDSVKKMENTVMEGAEKWLERFKATQGSLATGVAGSPLLGVYGTDFGWGRPKKVEIASIDRNGSIALAENRDDNRGVEVGLVLNEEEMKKFDSLFHSGLKACS